MALHHESAGNSAASGNAATPGTSSLVQARDTRPAGAFPLAAQALALGERTGQVFDGVDLLRLVGTLLQQHAEKADPGKLRQAQLVLARATDGLQRAAEDLDSLEAELTAQAVEAGHA